MNSFELTRGIGRLLDLERKRKKTRTNPFKRFWLTNNVYYASLCVYYTATSKRKLKAMNAKLTDSMQRAVTICNLQLSNREARKTNTQLLLCHVCLQIRTYFCPKTSIRPSDGWTTWQGRQQAVPLPNIRSAVWFSTEKFRIDPNYLSSNIAIPNIIAE